MQRAVSKLKPTAGPQRSAMYRGTRPAAQSRMPATTKKLIACLRIPNFPWQVEVVRHPEIQDRSAIVSGRTIDLSEESISSPGNALSSRVVLASSPDLVDVVPGMPLSEATARYRGVLVIEADTPLYAFTFDEILKNLECITPHIEAAAPSGLAYVDIWGLEGLYDDDAHLVQLLVSAAQNFDLRIGIGNNKWLAYTASLLSRANDSRKVTGEPGRFLEQLPVDSLPIPYELIKKMHTFGLTTMGHISDAPRGPMEAQFGPIGGTVWELANGIDSRPLIPKRNVLKVSEHLDFPDPTTSLSAIVPAIESLLIRAYGRAQLLHRFARQANIQSQVFQHASWSMRVAFKDPAGNKNQALFAIKSKLNMATFPGPLEDIRLTLSGITGEVGRQESMWKDVKLNDDLHETISQLGTRLKIAPPVYRVRELEPWSRIPERRYALVQLSGSSEPERESLEAGNLNPHS